MTIRYPVSSGYEQLHLAAFLQYFHQNIFQVSDTCTCLYRYTGEHGSTQNFDKISLKTNTHIHVIPPEQQTKTYRKADKVASESLPPHFYHFSWSCSASADSNIFLKFHLFLSLQLTCVSLFFWLAKKDYVLNK